jgi:hypothetical protein
LSTAASVLGTEIASDSPWAVLNSTTRQTKGPYTTYEAAEQAGMAIKKSHPIFQVAVYDVMARVNKIIEMPKV